MANQTQFRSVNGMRAYCEGVIAQQNGELVTTNPHDGGPDTVAHDDWDQGFNDSAAGSMDLSVCGYPAAGQPPAEEV